jgi:cytidylate kinase
MNQNIIIAGIFRSGKSTISNMISKEYGYQHIIMDSINKGFEKIFIV